MTAAALVALLGVIMLIVGGVLYLRATRPADTWATTRSGLLAAGLLLLIAGVTIAVAADVALVILLILDPQ